jgi:murein DD-endopeptidase MepM/ murein hydrolase activator NlpD
MLMSKLCNSGGTPAIGRPGVLAGAAALLVAAGAAGLWGGYRLGLVEAGGTPGPRIMAELDRQRLELAELRESSEAHLDALALRLGQMQARVARLDALGERLTEMGKLDAAEFSFGDVPARGGLDAGAAGQSTEAAELLGEIQGLSRLIADRERKLGLMEELLMSWSLSEEVRPDGRPVRQGWLSSGFGTRKDPFTGKKAFHHGMDFAAKEGSEVMAVAAGVVTWAGDRGGYGGLVEIDHGDGYLTRYAHNERLLVRAGDTVSKGQCIAHIGSSGRSTGPHVHFELLRHGKQVDPSKYLAAK